jgi:hypothetical protein
MGFRISGLFLIVWAWVNTYVDIQEYGWSEGNYWWFCNLALLGMGIALLIKSRGLLTGFLSIASFTQSIWLIDNIYRQSTGLSLFGLTDFMYRPGYPISKFVLSHYHYFTLLIGAYALVLLPKEKNQTLKLIAIFNPLIFGVSYFVFSPDKNINCIHSSCLPSFVSGEGPLFALCFWFVIFLIHLAIGYLMNEFFLRFNPVNAQRRVVHGVFAVGFLVAIGFSLHDVSYRMKMPRFSCNGPELKGGVEASCRHTKPLSDKNFLLSYSVKNKGFEDQYCKVLFDVDGKELEVEPGVNLLNGQELVQDYPLEQPQKDMVVQVKTNCERIPASVSP